MSHILAVRLAAQGHEVAIVTKSTGYAAGGGIKNEGCYKVAYSPSPVELIQLFRSADVVVQNNISVALGWPAWLLNKPTVIIHQTWIWEPGAPMPFLARVKRSLSARFEQIAISIPIAAQWHGCNQIWGNPYDDIEFRDFGRLRPRDVIFVGRLVDGKGADFLLESIAILRERGVRITATIIGDGPKKAALANYIRENQLGDQVQLMGAQRPREIVEHLNSHKIVVVPSQWREPFGVVALEGMACGCVAIGTDGGGLPEAIAGGGVIVPIGSALAIADAIARVLESTTLYEELKAAAANVVSRFGGANYAARLERLLQEMVSRRALSEKRIVSV